MDLNSTILKNILAQASTELMEHGEMGFTMPDGKHHIYIYADQETNWNGQGNEKFFVIEPNRVDDGAHEPMDNTYLTSKQDLAEVLIGCQWCLELFEEDRQREAKTQEAELPDELIVRLAHEAGWLEAEGKIEVYDWEDLRVAIRDAITEYYEHPSERNPFSIEDTIERILKERFPAEPEIQEPEMAAYQASEKVNSGMREILLPDFHHGRIYQNAFGALLCRHPSETQLRCLRSRIEDIEAGDCFISGGNLYIAMEDAHRNLDEPDEPWIVYEEENQESFFEEDIVDVARQIAALEHGKAAQQPSQGLPVNPVNLVMDDPVNKQTWSSQFWVDAKKVPTGDLFRACVRDFLSTEAGHAALEEIGETFNWGDAMIYIPDEHWNKAGLFVAYPALAPETQGLAPTPNCVPLNLVVELDEMLISESLILEVRQPSGKTPLDAQIQSASAKAGGAGAEKQQPQQELPNK